MTNSLELVSLRGVSAGYGGRDWVIDGIDLTINQGEVVGITGVSGVGKSSLLRVVAGLLQHEGSVEWPGGRKTLAYCPQEDVLLGYRTVWENAALLTERTTAYAWEAAATRTHSSLAAVGLAGRLGSMPADLSGGMRQRVQVVQAVTTAASLILLDEPFSQQDRDNQRALEDLVALIAEEEDSAFAIVSHDLDALATICDTVVFIGGAPGRIISMVRTPPDLIGLTGRVRSVASGFGRHAEFLWLELAQASRC